MKITLKTGILFAFGWMLVKLSLLGMGIASSTFEFSIMTNMLFLILAISVGLYLQKRRDTETGNALRDIKNGMFTGVPYAVLVSIFLFFYYEKINPEFIEHQISESEIALDKELNDPLKFQQLKDSNPDFEVMTKEQIREKIVTNTKGVYSAKSTAIIGLLAMTVYTTINSLLITAIYRKVVFKNKP
jgi:hypothetical protein